MVLTMTRHAKEFVIGESGFWADDVADMMVKLPGEGPLKRDGWITLAKILGSGHLNFEDLKVKLAVKSISHAEILRIILAEWRSNCGSEATLGNLIAILEEMELGEMGRKLENHFNRNVGQVSQTTPEIKSDKSRSLYILLVGFLFFLNFTYICILFSSTVENNITNFQTITVETAVGCENIMTKIPPGSKVDLTIAVENKHDWSNNIALVKSNLITKLLLEGDISIAVIMTILKDMVNLQHLTIRNSSRFLCQAENMRYTGQTNKLDLRRLKGLAFQGISECPPFYKKLSRCMEFSHLQVFRIDTGTISRHNIKYIHSLLRNATNSISSIEFINSAILTPLFDERLGVLSNVESITMDGLDDVKNLGNDIHFVDEKLCEYLQNLRAFLSQSGYLPYSQFLNLAPCRKLQNVTVGLAIPDYRNTIDMNEIRRMFPSLLVADFAFYFVNLSNGCSVKSVESSHQQFERLSYSVNCPNAESEST